MYCIYCGQKLIDNAIFCAFCGKRIEYIGKHSKDKNDIKKATVIATPADEEPEAEPIDEEELFTEMADTPAGHTGMTIAAPADEEEEIEALKRRLAELMGALDMGSVNAEMSEADEVKAEPASAGLSIEDEYLTSEPAVSEEIKTEEPVEVIKETPVSMGLEPQPKASDAVSLEDLFGEVPDDSEPETTKKNDKFYTLYRKNEEFQRLLDEEYRRIKGEGIGLLDDDNEEISEESNAIVEIANLYKKNEHQVIKSYAPGRSCLDCKYCSIKHAKNEQIYCLWDNEHYYPETGLRCADFTSLVQSKQFQEQPPKQVGPYPEVLDIIRLYREIKDNYSCIDKNERIRRCNEICIEYEWHYSHRDNEAWYPNVQAIWTAVCDKDVVYEGSRYPIMMMSDICLMIQERYT